MNRSNLLRILVFLAALSQPLVAYLSDLGDSSKLTDPSSNPLISPAAYAFSIWGVITLGSFAYSAYQLSEKRRNLQLHNAIAPYILTVFIGFSAWLYAAAQNWFWTTVLIFMIMGYCLYHAYARILKFRSTFTFFEKLITYGTFSLYTGWAIAAIFANIAAALKYSGWQDVGASGLAWQAGVLICSLVVSLFTIRRFRASLAFGATLLWAYVAIFVSTYQQRDESDYLVFVSAGAVVLIILYNLYERLHTVAK